MHSNSEMPKVVLSPFTLIDMGKPYKQITDLADILRETYFFPLLEDCEKAEPPLTPYERMKLKEISEKVNQYDRSPAEPPRADWPFIAFAGDKEKWVVSVLIGMLPGSLSLYDFRGQGWEEVDATNTIYFLNSLLNRVPLY
jgi:hypothetical protein